MTLFIDVTTKGIDSLTQAWRLPTLSTLAIRNWAQCDVQVWIRGQMWPHPCAVLQYHLLIVTGQNVLASISTVTRVNTIYQSQLMAWSARRQCHVEGERVL